MASLSQGRVARFTSRWLTDELNAFARGGNWEGALQTLSQMQQTNLVKQNVFHYTTVIKACSRAGKMEEAMSVFKQMKANKVPPNVYTYTTLINACAASKKVDVALRIFAEMRIAEVPPNVHTVTALITVCAKGGRWEKAFQVLDQCEDLLIAPNVLTYTAAMEACRQGGVCEPAVKLLLERMVDPSQVRPNEVTYNTLLGACVAEKNVPLTQRVYARMAADGYQPVPYTKDLLVECFRKSALDGTADSLSVRVKQPRWEAYMPDSDPVTALKATAGGESRT